MKASFAPFGAMRFGERVNLHAHFHVVASDGVFALLEEDAQGRGLVFVPTSEPSVEEVARLRETLRRKILRRMLKLKAVPEESVLELLRRERGGFSLDGSVKVEARDRRGLERLLRYVLRPAVSLKRLSYDAERGRVRYRMRRGVPRASTGTVRFDGAYAKQPEVLEWEAVDFLGRFADLMPPPRKHLVRYCGALGPRSNLRPAVTQAAREGTPLEDLLGGVTRGLPAVLRGARMIAQAARAISARARSWAACLRRVFEIEPIRCVSCGVEMRPIAAITDDRELDRILAHLSLPRDFPKTAPARSPPQRSDEETQVDPRVETWDGIDEGPQPDWAADWSASPAGVAVGCTGRSPMKRAKLPGWAAPRRCGGLGAAQLCIQAAPIGVLMPRKWARRRKRAIYRVSRTRRGSGRCRS